jgi:peptidyl-prolyl cis-trans isomerase SurA
VNPMKKLCLALIASASLSALASAQVVEQIVARVNNQIITSTEYQRSKDQLRDEVRQQDPSDADKVYADREKDVLRDLIDQQLLLEKGKDLGITGDTELIKKEDSMRKDMKLDSIEALEKEAQKQGISWEDFQQNLRNQIITQKVIGQEVGEHLSMSSEEEQKFYDEHRQEMQQPESIRLSEILIAPKPATPAGSAANDPNPQSGAATQSAENKPAAQPPDDPAALDAAKAKAEDLLKQIRGGASFEDIAKKYSDGPSAAEGGDLGVFTRGKLAKELEDKTFAMKAGDITDVIRTRQGYVILKVTDHQQAGIPPMKDPQVFQRIQDAIYYEKLQPALREYLTKLREEAYIKYAPGYVDAGASPNQTEPIETSASKEGNAKKLNKKKKKMGVLPVGRSAQ